MSIRMPRYFFNIVDDDRTIVDSQGVELADLDEVHQEAVTSARELMSESVLRAKHQMAGDSWSRIKPAW